MTKKQGNILEGRIFSNISKVFGSFQILIGWIKASSPKRPLMNM